MRQYLVAAFEFSVSVKYCKVPNGQSACLAKVYTGLRLNVPNLNIR